MNGCLNFIFSEKIFEFVYIILFISILYPPLYNILSMILQPKRFEVVNILIFTSNFLTAILWIYLHVYWRTDLYKNRHIKYCQERCQEHCQNKIEIVEKKN
ncbi:MAG: hypothetical protein RI930_413 [Pseudomonadota bacterium]